MNPSDDIAIFQLQEALAVLEATPAVLRSLLGRLPHDWLHFQEALDAWSPYTVLVHLVHNERTNWMPRVRVVLSDEPVRTFAPFHQLPEADEEGDGEVEQLLTQFTQLRREGLAFVRGLRLGPAEFGRQAEHPVLGTVTLRQLLATWVVHDLNHLHQIMTSMAKRYRGTVGPWRQYLAVLDQ